MDGWLHVAAAVIDDGCGNVLIAQRPVHLHQGGLWEFPGGKVERGETVRDALARELDEEIGIQVEGARPLIRVRHDYGDRRVLLDVWRVERFSGVPYGREGQGIRWVSQHELPSYPYPAANLPIVTAARLPPFYLITPEPGTRPEWPLFLERLAGRLRSGIRLIQFRATTLSPDDYRELAEKVVVLCRREGGQVLFNALPEVTIALKADGVHLPARRLRELRERPLPSGMWVAASCHDEEELVTAARIGVDFAVLSPVTRTATHPDSVPLGWPRFGELLEKCRFPVFALGGVTQYELATSWQHGGQGIAAIRGLWETDETLLAHATAQS